MKTLGWGWLIAANVSLALGIGMAAPGVSAVSRAQEATPAAAVAPPVDLAALSGTIIADGSSTVWPITAEAAERFAALTGVVIEVEISGTGGGFRRFCDGGSDVQNASRPIDEEEATRMAGHLCSRCRMGRAGIRGFVNSW